MNSKDTMCFKILESVFEQFTTETLLFRKVKRIKNFISRIGVKND